MLVLNKEQIRNQELYEKVKNFVTKSFILLDEKINGGEKFSYRTAENISVDEEGSTAQKEAKVHWHLLSKIGTIDITNNTTTK